MTILFTEEHEWLRPEGDLVTVGITAHASEQLGDVVFIELPEVGRIVEKGEEICVIESVKAASDILAPVAGEIVAVNEVLPDTPGAVNENALGTWFFQIRISDPAALAGFMDEAAYTNFIG
ncbi:glycine cleavage system H protein [Rhodobacter aestuarii]|uniref:Glycine cleavage system H protein n=1 Tax=Rhodobacter aestuarii TaxID=453582 RepID=A0A1N7KWE5_9RHOB|nr:glycine cleavage system H protein [Rhodobacter aestuarii]SIS65730.1 glycine cleavage system H protein [Rhodobacter aestuarii]